MEGGGAVDGYAAHVLVLRVEGEERKEQGKSGCCASVWAITGFVIRIESH